MKAQPSHGAREYNVYAMTGKNIVALGNFFAELSIPLNLATTISK